MSFSLVLVVTGVALVLVISSEPAFDVLTGSVGEDLGFSSLMHESHQDISPQDCSAMKEVLRLRQDAGVEGARVLFSSLVSRGEMRMRMLRRAEDQCWSRHEWPCFFQGHGNAPSPALQDALHAQLQQRVRCREMEDLETVTEKLVRGERTGCKYLIWRKDSTTELGEKVLSLASALVYALLTERVLLVDSGPASLTQLFCDPLPGPHSWDYPYLQELSSTWTIWKTLQKTTNNTCSLQSQPPPNTAFMGTLHLDKRGVHFCADFHHWMDSSSAIVQAGNQFYLPAFYSVPQWRDTLSSLFPTHSPLTTLLPLLMKPTNLIWVEVTRRLLDLEAKPALRVGVELQMPGEGLTQESNKEQESKTEAKALGDSARAIAHRVQVHLSSAPGEDTFQRRRLDSGEAEPGTVKGLLGEALSEAGVRDKVEILIRNRGQEGGTGTSKGSEGYGERIVEVEVLGLGADLLFSGGSSPYGAMMRALSKAPVFSPLTGLKSPGECYSTPWREPQCCSSPPAQDLQALHDSLYAPCTDD